MTPNFLTVAACTSAMAGEDDEKLRHLEAPKLLERPRAAAEVAILCMVVVYCWVDAGWSRINHNGRKSTITSRNPFISSASLGQASLRVRQFAMTMLNSPYSGI
jgi:hypothetical protein